MSRSHGNGGRKPRAREGLLDVLGAVPVKKAEDGFFSPLFRFDESLGRRPLAGLDEAGRGPLAGPLVAAAVVLPEGFDHRGIDDSKRLTAEDREKAFEVISSQAISWAFAVIGPDEVDRLNPLGASMLAMGQALERLLVAPVLALADGDKCPRSACPVMSVVKGDSRSLSIAAASIIAKVTRDRLMLEEHARFPQYGFDRHKGYGTRAHLEAIRKHGPSPIHRLSFRGVRPEGQDRPAPPMVGPTLF
ncbi:MAG: ribonuclease HII [Deltaproteobacteria bacterium]|jgi:ribonuclease HII|nr:ribonuclease HII [Deltaproteobacteria bacterium]